METTLQHLERKRHSRQQSNLSAEHDLVETLQIASPRNSGSTSAAYRNRLLQKRQKAFEKAPNLSKLCANQGRQKYHHEGDQDADWISDDHSSKVADNPLLSSSEVRKLRDRRRSSSSFQEHHKPRMQRYTHVTGNRRRYADAYADQSWIESLERENEDLLLQVSSLTQERAAMVRDLQARLKDATEQIWMLQQQLVQRDNVIKNAAQTHARELAALKPRLPILDTPKSRHNRRFSEIVCSSSDLEGQIARLLKEKELAESKARKRDEELLRIKRRNAVLAEQILEKRSLEITVEGQSRYLAELTTALDESRRTGSSEPAQSPPPLISPSSPEYTSYASFFAAHATLRSRPVSFDGTRIERRQVFDSLLPDAERERATSANETCLQNGLNLSTPATPNTACDADAKDLMRIPRSVNRSPPPDLSTTPHTTQSYRKSTYPCIRPSLQRNESSLWHELEVEHEDSVHSGSSDTTLGDESSDLMERATVVSTGLKSDVAEMRKASVTEYAIKFSGVTISSSMRIALAGWDWLRFWALLMAAIALLVVEGPASLLGRPQSQIRASSGSSL